MWNNQDPDQVVGTTAILKETDSLTVTVDDILKAGASISSAITKEDTWLCGFGSWFDAHFKMSSIQVSVAVFINSSWMMAFRH
ncbi:putative methyltransferase [Helianthus annuus]|uniref:Methyltransferase n=1 Tax=Helianthus annuus TaxID=4232 RepID=A0A251V9K2_HELAN|nr:putative methyltransferase [Helianthus annuus]KAJ0508510.1 putative methyltransferase [Helianthus annuus]KAJ0516762.1 putative methyltransferase [Helianthus annuus]KAJ0684764.1 putative methyltransferase [Helianthus annuus]